MSRQTDDDALGWAQFAVSEMKPEDRKAAVRNTASLARNADDLAMLCDAMGLDPAEGRKKL